MVTDNLAVIIIAAVDAEFAQQLEFTKDVVRFKTERSLESEGQRFIYHALEERGYQMDRWAIDIIDIEDYPGFSPDTVDYGNAFNVVGTHESRKFKGRSLILNGHIDVVPTSPLAMWQRPLMNPPLRVIGYMGVGVEI